MDAPGHCEFALHYETPSDWVDTVLGDFDQFLLDHAAAEKKASSMAMTLVAHYPDRPELVRAMVDLAVEELTHYRAVVKLIAERGLQLAPDEKDAYVNAFRGVMRRSKTEFLMDRLLVAGIIEARGAERFGLVADALDAGPLKRFYRSITRSENNHRNLFLDLALVYAPRVDVQPRLEQLLAIEAEIVRSLPLRPALH